MRRGLLVALTLAASAHASLDAPLASPTRSVGGAENMAIQQYSLGLGKELVKEYLDLDVDAWALSWERQSEAFARQVLDVPAGEAFSQDSRQMPGGAVPSSALAQGAPHPRGLDIRLDMTGDLLRARNLRELPMALRISGRQSWLGLPLQTRISVPLSWNDSLVAGAKAPMPQLDVLPWERLLEAFGLENNWDLSSQYSNRLGVNQFETGLGTRWREDWRFDYDYRTRSGQGDFEASHWLKLGREF